MFSYVANICMQTHYILLNSFLQLSNPPSTLSLLYNSMTTTYCGLGRHPLTSFGSSGKPVRYSGENPQAHSRNPAGISWAVPRLIKYGGAWTPEAMLLLSAAESIPVPVPKGFYGNPDQCQGILQAILSVFCSSHQIVYIRRRYGGICYLPPYREDIDFGYSN